MSIKVADLSRFTISSPTDRFMRKEVKNMYREIKERGGTLDLQMRVCKGFFEDFKNNNFEKDLADIIFYTKEVCNLFIKSEEEFYKTLPGILLSLQKKIFKCFGWKTKIEEAKEIVNDIENNALFKILMADFNIGVFESEYGNNITNQDDIIKAIEDWQKNGTWQSRSFKIKNSEELYKKINFPDIDATKLIQSEIIELNNVVIVIEEREEVTVTLSLIRDRNNHWYAVLEDKPIGEGTSKLVYEGWNLSDNEPAAIGVNKNPGSVKGIKREYKTYEKNQLNDPGIAKTHTLIIKKLKEKNPESTEKKCFFIQKLYERSLKSRIEKQNTVERIWRKNIEKNSDKIVSEFKQKIMMTKDILNGVSQAHKKNVIHRDIKPGNILLDDHDHAVITDFDFAVSSIINEDIKEKNKTRGTPLYVPPEELVESDNRSEDITQKADVWSLGATLFEMWYGKSFFGPLYDRAKKAAVQAGDPNRAMGIFLDDYLPKVTQSQIDGRFKEKSNKLVPHEINEFINSMMQICKEDRPNIDTLLVKFEEIEKMYPQLLISDAALILNK